MNDEVQLFDGLHPLGALRHHAQLVAAAVDPHAGLIGLARQDSIADAGGMACPPNVQTLMLHAAETLLQLTLGQALGSHGNGIVGHLQHAAGAEALQQSTGTLHVAHQQVDGSSRHSSLHGVGGLVGSHAESEAAGGVLAEHLHSLFDLLGIEPADLACLLEGVFLHALPQQLIARLVDLAVHHEFALQCRVEILIEGIGHGLHGIGLLIPHHEGVGHVGVVADLGAQEHLGLGVHQVGQVRPLHDEVGIEELVLQNVAGPAQQQRYVRTGTDGQPNVGLGSVGGKAGVNRDGLNAPGAELHHGVTAAGRAGIGRRRTPQCQTLDGGIIGEVQLQSVGVGDTGVNAAVHHGIGQHAGQIALGAAGLKPVGGAEHIAETGDTPNLGVTAAARGAEHRLRAVLLAGVHQLLGDGGQRLIPRDTLPLSAAALAHTLEGELVAVGVIQRLNARQTLGAHTTLAHGVFVVALQLDDATVLHIGQHAAVGDTGAAAGLDDFYLVILYAIALGAGLKCALFGKNFFPTSDGKGIDGSLQLLHRYPPIEPPRARF